MNSKPGIARDYPADPARTKKGSLSTSICWVPPGMLFAVQYPGRVYKAISTSGMRGREEERKLKQFCNSVRHNLKQAPP